jgi:hypothetical protein
MVSNYPPRYQNRKASPRKTGGLSGNRDSPGPLSGRVRHDRAGRTEAGDGGVPGCDRVRVGAFPVEPLPELLGAEDVAGLCASTLGPSAPENGRRGAPDQKTYMGNPSTTVEDALQQLWTYDQIPGPVRREGPVSSAYGGSSPSGTGSAGGSRSIPVHSRPCASPWA